LTSQLVIINQAGVAAASDTLTTHQEPHGEIKTIPSNTKIHQVGQEHLVAVLHCGGVFLGGIQWSTLMREWSLALGSPLAHLDDYAESFAEWVADNSELFSFNDASMMAWAICQEFSDLFGPSESPLAKVLKEKADKPDSLNGEDFEAAVVIALKGYMKESFTNDPYGDLTSEGVIKTLEVAKVDVYQDFLKHAAAYGEFEFSNDFKTFLMTFAGELLTRFVYTGGVMCLNFIGFGTKDLMGRRVQLQIRSLYGGRLRYALESSGSADPKEYPMWFPLAQQDAIGSFMWGVDYDSRAKLRNMALDLLSKKVTLSEQQVAEFKDEFDTFSIDYLRDNFAAPLRDTIETLGIASLTRFAEMLIRFQCLRSASLAGEATVGGYVESLEITRDHGVQWQRKIALETHSIEDASHVFA
jgi:hypothetical protein